MTDKIPVRYLPDEEAQPSFGEMRPGDTVPVSFGGTGGGDAATARTNLGLGSAAVRDAPDAGDAGADEVVLGSDSRLGAPGGAGDMSKAVYDPTLVEGDTFARANHTGTQLLVTISDAGTAAAKNVPAAGDATADQVVMGNDSRLLSDADKYVAVSNGDAMPGNLLNKLSSLDNSVVFSLRNAGANEILDLQATGAGGGQANIGTNLGGALGVYAGMNGVALQFRTLLGTSTVAVTLNGDQIHFAVPDGVFDVSGSASAVQNNLDTHKTSSDHDGRYYTETEMDGFLALKADVADLGTAAAEDIGTTVGDIPVLEDVGGSPGLPAVDGSQLTGIDFGGIEEPADDSIPYMRATATGVSNWVASGSAAILDVGTAIGDIPVLEDVGGNPGLPAVDGSQLTGIDVGGIEEPPDDDTLNMRQTTGGVSGWVNAGGAAVLDVGNTAGDVAAGNVVVVHEAAFDHTNIPTQDQKDALDNNASLNAGDPVASMADIAIVGDTRYPPLARTITTLHSITGGGDLSQDRTFNLVNDTAVPGNDKYYGTDGTGTRGFHDLPTGGGGIPEPDNDGTPKMRQTLTGTSTWVDAGNAATKDVGTAPGTVAPGDDSRFITADQQEALDNNSTLNSGNPVASMADIAGVFPVRPTTITSPTALATELGGEAFSYQGANGDTPTWTAPLPSGGVAADYEYTCSVDFLACSDAGSYSVSIPAGWQQMGATGAIVVADTDDPVSVILRSRADGTIQIYRSETGA